MAISGPYTSKGKDLTLTAASVNLSSSDPKMQAVLDAGKQQLANTMKAPITVLITWKSDNEFSLVQHVGLDAHGSERLANLAREGEMSNPRREPTSSCEP